MDIREALGRISVLPYIGNAAGSYRDAKGFETTVANILRSVGATDTVIERPNGSNGYPSFSHNGIDYQIKTSKGTKPMWNEVYVRENSVLILNLRFGTVVVHGSLITDSDTEDMLIDAKDFVAKTLRSTFPHSKADTFYVSGGRVQFGDNINWESSRKTFLDETIKILEK